MQWTNRKIRVCLACALAILAGSIIWFALDSGFWPGAPPAEDRSTRVIERDPATMGELLKIVEQASGEGCVRVRFPSGEWNWVCQCELRIPQKAELTSWVTDDRDFDMRALDDWIYGGKVSAVQLCFGSGVDPALYFAIERRLREGHVHYWVLSSTDPSEHSIRFHEANGTAKVLTDGGER